MRTTTPLTLPNPPRHRADLTRPCLNLAPSLAAAATPGASTTFVPRGARTVRGTEMDVGLWRGSAWERRGVPFPSRISVKDRNGRRGPREGHIQVGADASLGDYPRRLRPATAASPTCGAISNVVGGPFPLVLERRAWAAKAAAAAASRLPPDKAPSTF